MATIVLTGAWQQIASTATKLVLSVSDRADLFIAAGAPVAGDTGLDVRDDCILDLDNLDLLGGAAWVRGTGVATYFSG